MIFSVVWAYILAAFYKAQLAGAQILPGTTFHPANDAPYLQIKG